MSDFKYEESDRGAGWLLFAGVMIALASFLNIVGGISAISDANFYVGEARTTSSAISTPGAGSS